MADKCKTCNGTGIEPICSWERMDPDDERMNKMVFRRAYRWGRCWQWCCHDDHWDYVRGFYNPAGYFRRANSATAAMRITSYSDNGAYFSLGHKHPGGGEDE